jgi:hypothetical protein
MNGWISTVDITATHDRSWIHGRLIQREFRCLLKRLTLKPFHFHRIESYCFRRS